MFSVCHSSLAIEKAKVAVPSQRDDIDNQNSVVQRDKLEVDCLDERPHHPVLLYSGRICAIQLLLRAATLQDSHAAEEAEQVGGSEEKLIGSDTGSDFEILVLQDDLVLEEFEPCCRSRTEDDCLGRLLA
jgi:hypothetical protein